MILGSCSISRRNVDRYFEVAQANAPYDVIIVPGVPYDGEHWQSVMQIRVYWSQYLHQNGITNNIIYSGGAVYSKYSEAKVMRLFGLALNLPEDKLYLDTLAEHSVENVYSSYQIAKKQGFERIALATDPFQSKSMRKFIKKHNLPIDLIPIVFDTLRTFDRPEPTIDSSSAIEPDFISIKERESFFIRLAGTMGKQIIWYKEDLSDPKLIRKYERKKRLITD